jgi:hypothetical protein
MHALARDPAEQVSGDDVAELWPPRGDATPASRQMTIYATWARCIHMVRSSSGKIGRESFPKLKRSRLEFVTPRLARSITAFAIGSKAGRQYMHDFRIRKRPSWRERVGLVVHSGNDETQSLSPEIVLFRDDF